MNNKNINIISKDLHSFFEIFCDLDKSSVLISSSFNYCIKKNHNTLINLQKINNLRNINTFFKKVNNDLNLNDIFICCVETIQARKKRKKISKIPLLNNFYFFFDYIFLRVFPKVRYLQKLYYIYAKRKVSLLSKAEAMGRLIFCGFKIIDIRSIDGYLYIVSKKEETPKSDLKPSYGPVFKMPRIGKSKKIFYFYKIRTMHPYSEYLQEYIYLKNGTTKGDKIINDFRISTVGSFFRKYWIDELPMLINLFKGEIKIVGVRPLSKHKFSLYPKDIQDLRSKFKPGLIPPFYADNPNSFDELVKSEVNYLKQFSVNPILTDIRYFFLSLKNIIFKGARSK